MKDLNIFNQYRIKLWGSYGDSANGKFIIPRKDKFGYYQVIASDGLGWNHVSDCLLDNQKDLVERSLRWEEMCEVKDICFSENEAVIQVHSNIDFNKENSFYTLHLWRPLTKNLPLPNPIMVGFTKKYSR